MASLTGQGCGPGFCSVNWFIWTPERFYGACRVFKECREDPESREQLTLCRCVELAASPLPCSVAAYEASFATEHRNKLAGHPRPTQSPSLVVFGSFWAAVIAAGASSQIEPGPYLSDLALCCIQNETLRSFDAGQRIALWAPLHFCNNWNNLFSLKAAVPSSPWTLSS